MSLCGDPKPFCDTCRSFREIQINGALDLGAELKRAS